MEFCAERKAGAANAACPLTPFGHALAVVLAAVAS